MSGGQIKIILKSGKGASREMLPSAPQFNCSAYDAAYLALARGLGDPFITADERLYNAVHPALDWGFWIADYLLEAE